MGIKLGKPPGSPSIKLRKIGDAIVGHVCHVEAVPWIEFGTDKPKIGHDGKPRTQDKVTLLVREGTAVVKDGEDSEREVVAGEQVAVYLAGHRRFAWIEAQRKVPGGLEVGQVIRIAYVGDEPSKGGAPKKVWQMRLRVATEAEQVDVQTAEAIYRGLATAAPKGSAVAEEDSGEHEYDERNPPPPEDDLPF
jgi:hypothetical protein